MSSAYSRHTGVQGARLPSRTTGGKGHAASWSISSGDNLRSAPVNIPDQQEATTALTSPSNPILDATYKRSQPPRWALLADRIRPHTFRQFSLRKVIIFLILTFVLFSSAWIFCKDQKKLRGQDTQIQPIDAYLPPLPQLPAGYLSKQEEPHPVRWLRANTFLDIKDMPAQYLETQIKTRPNAALIALVRNEELDDMVASIRQLEIRFNGRETHRYDWVFFNNEEFTDEFKMNVANATSSRCYFELIPTEHWSIPPWIDVTRFDVGRQFMGGIGVGKAWLQSYHHMCRWNAGIFALEKRLADYNWFWRVEPAVQYGCDINYDVFRFMQDNDMAYGFNMAILDDARSFPSLWERTRTFIDKNEDLVDEDADFNWLLHTTEEQGSVTSSAAGLEATVKDGEYNNCQFYSNFEIGSLDFFRGKEHRAYFDYLDKAGGFYYERFGDAPVHTLSVSMFLPKRRIWYFRDIGYAHGLCEQCPPHEHKSFLGPELDVVQARAVEFNGHHEAMLVAGPGKDSSNIHRRWAVLAQDVEHQKGIPALACGCTVSAIDNNNDKLVPYESKQRKPLDPCIQIIAGDNDPEYVLDGREGNPFR
ncbi:glycolipid 2-alpha-mannosyltransferase-domain-containing protein [Xylariaceae sp. FL0662B]|nr:glycolipid 2-alpha-mannosyltransferase-domain-containing protein [Xylariaceae sp. FL0662B]